MLIETERLDSTAFHRNFNGQNLTLFLKTPGELTKELMREGILGEGVVLEDEVVEGEVVEEEEDQEEAVDEEEVDLEDAEALAEVIDEVVAVEADEAEIVVLLLKEPLITSHLLVIEDTDYKIIKS